MRLRIRHIKAVRLRNVGIDSLNSVCDLFVSLHSCLPDNELLYVSEVAQSNAHPDFAPFIFPSAAPTADCNIVCKIWARPDHATSWTCVLVLKFNLNMLLPISSSTTPPFPSNSILLILRESIYLVPSVKGISAMPAVDHDYSNVSYGRSIQHQRSTSFVGPTSVSQLSVHPTDFQNTTNGHRPPSVQTQPSMSYDYDTLRSITSATRSIQEITVSNYQLQNRISAALASRRASTFPIHRIHQLESALSSQRDRNHTLSSRIAALDSSLKSLKMNVEIIRSVSVSSDSASGHQSGLRSQLQLAVLPALANEIRSQVLAISEVFPIIPRGSLGLSIVGIPFPETISSILNTCYARPLTEETTEQVNAAMGFIAQIVSALTRISNTQPYGYRIIQRGSRCLITQGPPAKLAPLLPLYYDPATDETVPRSSPSSQATIRNPGFERGLLMLNQALLHIIDVIASQARGHLGTPLLDCIPTDCADNILWTIHWILLYVTALAPPPTTFSSSHVPAEA